MRSPEHSPVTERLCVMKNGCICCHLLCSVSLNDLDLKPVSVVTLSGLDLISQPVAVIIVCGLDVSLLPW